MFQYRFAENLCRICKEKHISVNELAEMIGKSPRQVNRYRNGGCTNISCRTLEEIAKALQVDLCDLLR